MKGKLILVSKDVGSSVQNNLLISDLQDLNFEIDIYSQNPGIDYYSSKNVFSVPENIDLNSFFKEIMQQPSICGVLVGFSSKENGIDEIASQVARAFLIPTFAIQDFWGNRGVFTIEQIPQNIFIANKFAKSISTEFFLDSNLIVTGLPKYDEFISRELVETNKPTNIKKRVVVFMQPLDFELYYRSYHSILESLQKLSKDITIISKFHPATSKFHIEEFKTKYSKIDFCFNKKNIELFEELDLLITVDSTCAIDFYEFSQVTGIKKTILSCQFKNSLNEIQNFSKETMDYIGAPIYSEKELIETILNSPKPMNASKNSDIMHHKFASKRIAECINTLVNKD